MNNLYLFASAVSLIVMAYLAIKEAKSKKENNVASAIKQLAEALNLQGDELVENIAEAAKLRSVVEDLRKQVERLTGQQRENMAEIDSLKYQNQQLRDKYNKAIEILVKALDDAHIPVPQELALLLGDSISKFKFPRKP